MENALSLTYSLSLSLSLSLLFSLISPRAVLGHCHHGRERKKKEREREATKNEIIILFAGVTTFKVQRRK